MELNMNTIQEKLNIDNVLDYTKITDIPEITGKDLVLFVEAKKKINA